MPLLLIFIATLGLHRQGTLGFPGKSTAGLTFVISSPVQGADMTFFIFTDEDLVQMKLTAGSGISCAKRNRLAGREISRSDDIVLIRTQSSTNCPYLLLATGPIRAKVIFSNNADLTNANKIAMINLMPKKSCYRSYYVSTVKHHPFILVSSFDASKTILTIRFPYESVKSFNLDCGGNDICAPGHKVIVTLSPYMIWNLSIGSLDYAFRNVLIASSHPVFVVAGSLECERLGYCISEMRPTVSWGKSYALPAIDSLSNDSMQLLVNAIHTPLLLTVQSHDSDDRSINVKHGDLINAVSFAKFNAWSIITAEEQFGLYVYITRPRTSCGPVFFSLIPSVQWLEGVYVPKLTSSIQVANTYMACMTDRALFKNRTDPDFNWTNIGSTLFAYRNLVSMPVGLTVTMLETYLRMMVYISMRFSVNGCIHEIINPWDFYQAKVFNPFCRKSFAVAGDGVDNDCDGAVDEEADDQFDNDEDGFIDEDTVEKYGDGNWEVWIQFCPQNYDVRGRQCSGRSRFGKFCDRNAAVFEVEGNYSESCLCSDGCDSCGSSNGLVCSKCKDGYDASKYCRRLCRTGWCGPGCVYAIYKEKKIPPTELPFYIPAETPFPQFIVYMIYAFLGIAGIGAGLMIYSIWQEHKYSKKNLIYICFEVDNAE